MSEFIDIICQSERYEPAFVIGYSDREISHIEKLYQINVTGQLFHFLNQIGRCAGNVIGGDRLIVYSEKTVKQQVAYQFWRRENGGAIQYNPFYLGIRIGEDVLLKTSDPDDDTVYTLNREKRELESTGKTLLDTVSECIFDKQGFFSGHEPVSFQGELIKID